MPMTPDELRNRTKQFALRNMRLFRALPRFSAAEIVGKQLVRSSTSVAANYRAACRARSHAEFLAKLCIVVEEADETLFWLEMLVESGSIPERRLDALRKEAEELLAIFSSARRTAAAKAKLGTLHNHQITNSPN